MEFKDLVIGQKFVHGVGTSAAVYRKKSLSSAYVLDAESLEYITDDNFFHNDKIGSFIGVSGACVVYPLA
jgi:hypothetical protein